VIYQPRLRLPFLITPKLSKQRHYFSSQDVLEVKLHQPAEALAGAMAKGYCKYQ
jgi:hypothetical protein